MSRTIGASLGRDDDREVTCVACGETLRRGDAREYDKYGDRWSREGKSFEYLCKPCDSDLCHQPRDGLEETLVAAEAGRVDRDAFLRRVCDRLADDGESTRTETE